MCISNQDLNLGSQVFCDNAQRFELLRLLSLFLFNVRHYQPFGQYLLETAHFQKNIHAFALHRLAAKVIHPREALDVAILGKNMCSPTQDLNLGQAAYSADAV